MKVYLVIQNGDDYHGNYDVMDKGYFSKDEAYEVAHRYEREQEPCSSPKCNHRYHFTVADVEIDLNKEKKCTTS